MTGVTGLILAAGAGSRFGGGKLLATIGGRPVLGHVLDTIAQLDRPRQASAERRRGRLDERRIEVGGAERPGQLAVVGDDELGLGRRPVARLVRSELARWRVPGEWRDDRRAVSAGP